MHIKFKNMATKKENLLKWNKVYLEQEFGRSDLLPLWVANMDFFSPRDIQKQLTKFLKNEILGYSTNIKAIDEFINWMYRKFNCQLNVNEVLYGRGILNTIATAIQLYSDDDAYIMIQEPVYYEFRKIITNNGRKILSNPLILKDNKYEIDYEQFECLAKNSKTQIFILCSPHNPIGKVWKKFELEKMLDICLRNNVFVIADEVHSDFIFNPNKHYPICSLDRHYVENSMVCYSPSKTFNLSGIKISTVVISDSIRRIKYQNYMTKSKLSSPDIIAAKTLEIAYRKGNKWLDKVLIILNKNREYVFNFIKKYMPKVAIINHEGTYLVWLDFSEYMLTDNELRYKFIHLARVAVSFGDIFGEGGSGFIRINIACSKKILKQALKRLYYAFHCSNLIN